LPGPLALRSLLEKKKRRQEPIRHKARSSGNSAFEARARVGLKFTCLEPRPSTIGKQGPMSCELVPCAASMRARTKARPLMLQERISYVVSMPLMFSPYFLDIFLRNARTELG